MKCHYGFQIGHDYDKYDDCNCSGCSNEVYNYCRNYNKSCVNKADFGSQIIAEREARIRSSIAVNYIAYKCLYCGGWHIGKNFGD